MNTEPTMTPETRELVERLRAKVHKGQFAPGGGTIGADGRGSVWGGEKIMEYANPDGPAAADTIERQAARIAELEGWNEGLRSQITQLQHPCSPHCVGYLQSLTAADEERDRIVKIAVKFMGPMVKDRFLSLIESGVLGSGTEDGS